MHYKNGREAKNGDKVVNAKSKVAPPEPTVRARKFHDEDTIGLSGSFGGPRSGGYQAARLPTLDELDAAGGNYEAPNLFGSRSNRF